MVACKDADAMITGNTRRYSSSLEKIIKVVDPRPGEIMFGLNLVVNRGKTIFICDTSVIEYPDAKQLANCLASGYSMTDVSQIKIVLPLFTTKFKPNIISPGLGSTTLIIFSSDDEYLLVFPVIIASASLHATMHDAQITLSFLISLLEMTG